jgi:hypothetical protein
LVLLGKTRITSESDDPLVRMVEQLQAIDIQEAVLSGPRTREWRTTMLDVAGRLVAAVEGAEKVIQDRGGVPLVDIGQNGDVSLTSQDSGPGLYELDTQLQAGMEDFTTVAGEVTVSLADLTAVVEASTQRMKDAPRDVIISAASDLARDLEGITMSIQRAGGQMETIISAVDADLRQYYALIMEFGSEDMKQSTQRDVDSLEENFAEIRKVMDILSEFITQIQPVEVLSAPLRKSLRPLRLGVNSIQVAIGTMESWTKLGH